MHHALRPGEKILVAEPKGHVTVAKYHVSMEGAARLVLISPMAQSSGDVTQPFWSVPDAAAKAQVAAAASPAMPTSITQS